MSRLLLLLTILMLVSLCPCRASDYTQPEPPIQLASAGQQTSELQKQSDHHNRVNQEKKEREVERQVAAVGAVQTESRGLDNFVLIMLVVSAGALFIVSKRLRLSRSKRRRGRRLPAR